MRLNTVARTWRGLELDKDLELTVRKRQKSDLGIYQAIGPLSTIDKKSEYDLIEAIVELPHGAQLQFIEGYKARCPRTNLVFRSDYISPTSSSYKVYRRHVKTICDAGLAVQLKQQTIRHLHLYTHKHYVERCGVYMINPHFIRARDNGNAKVMWQQIQTLQS